jgi:CheY-like chemotaxis protein
VEDNDDALRAMSLLLTRSGYGVLSAHNFDEAMAMTSHGKCDLLISDVVLEGRSGLALMHELKARHGLKGIIAVSSHVSPIASKPARPPSRRHWIYSPSRLLILPTPTAVTPQGALTAASVPAGKAGARRQQPTHGSKLLVVNS